MSLSNQELPVIDIGEIDSYPERLALAITKACKEWGFFLVKGHLIPQGDIQQIFALGKEFFDLPDDEKDPYVIDLSRTGYVGSFKDKFKGDKASMYFGGIRKGYSPSTPSLPPYFYPHIETIETFRASCYKLAMKLLRCFAISFGIDPDYFANGHNENELPGDLLRLLHYPARNEPPMDGVTRLIPHTDSRSVTLLFQKNPGLDVMSPTGEWVRVPAWDDHILINIGDALQFWSGNQLKSTMHRVTFEGLPHDRERYSMAYFCGADNDTVLQPLLSNVESEKLIGWDGKPIGSITAGEYYAQVFDDLYAGLSPSEHVIASS